MEENNYENFVLDFFSELGCDVQEEGGGFIIGGIPRAFVDLMDTPVVLRGVLKICFLKDVDSFELVTFRSVVGRAIRKFLDDAGKMTLVKIEFDVDPQVEIEKRISLKNCSVENVVKRHRHNFFSRFSFLTTFRYLNMSEKVLHEVYVHDSKVVLGDLGGYDIGGGDLDTLLPDISEELQEVTNKNFLIAKKHLKVLNVAKTDELSRVVGEKLDLETKRVEDHYKNQLSEFGGALNTQLDKVRELELEMRFSEGEKKDILKNRIEKQRLGLLKLADDEAASAILKEQEFSLEDVRQKFSLDVSHKVVNTTIIYYPVFLFNLFLKNSDSKRFVELVYDPLLRDFSNLYCDSCSQKISEILLCGHGHIVCDSCLTRCAECGKDFCRDCVLRSCASCGKALCKNCLLVCRGCSKSVCATHLRVDCVSGEERCIMCLRSCSRCHGVAGEAYFGVALDGSKVCDKCLGVERREVVLRDVFE